MPLDLFLETAERLPDGPAVSDPTRALSYSNLRRLADVMRRQVERATDCPRVGLMLPSSAGFAGTFFGALWAGRTAIPLNFLLNSAELRAIVEDAGLDAIFTIRHFADLLHEVPARKIFLEELPLKREMILERFRRPPPAPGANPDDLAVILYTSGTVGAPKGVCLTHRNLRSNAQACIEAAQLTGRHRFLGILPLFHTFGLTAMLIVPAALGAAVHYLPRFGPAAVVHAVRDLRISVVMAVASMYGALLRLKDASRDDFQAVAYAISGGEPLPQTVYDGFRERFGLPLVQGYGLTETAPVVSLDLPWAHRPGTVGRAVPGVRVAAFDDAGHQLPPAQEGELWISGPNVMQGYYRRPEDTAAVLTPDGWFKSGDLGSVDADGYIRITGRKKELIIVGGDNVYPREIETVLDAHPAVAESAVVGAPDATRGEVVVAFAVLKEGAAASEVELREHCRGLLAGYKVPRRVIIRSDLPRGPTGKLLKRKLKELL